MVIFQKNLVPKKIQFLYSWFRIYGLKPLCRKIYRKTESVTGKKSRVIENNIAEIFCMAVYCESQLCILFSTQNYKNEEGNEID